MRFMMIMIPDVYRRPVPPNFAPDPEAIRKMGEFNEQLQKAGALLALDGLTPPAMGARVSFSSGKPVVTDGPFAESKEVIGGFWIIRANSRDDAIAWAKRCPADARDVIEIRQIFEPADLDA